MYFHACVIALASFNGLNFVPCAGLYIFCALLFIDILESVTALQAADDEFSSDLSTVEDRVMNLNSTLIDIDGRMEDLNVALTEVEERVSGNEAGITDLDERVGQMEVSGQISRYFKLL